MRSKSIVFQEKDRSNSQETPGALGKVRRLLREHWLQSAPSCPQTSMVWESVKSGQVITVWKAEGRLGWGRGWGRQRKEACCPQYKAQCCFHWQLLCPQSLTDPTYINMRTKTILAQHIISFSFRMWKEFQLIHWASLGTWPSISEAAQGIKSSVRPRDIFYLLGNSQVCCNIINLRCVFRSSFLSTFQTWPHPVPISPE